MVPQPGGLQGVLTAFQAMGPKGSWRQAVGRRGMAKPLAAQHDEVSWLTTGVLVVESI
jgi:hypothetical protein